MKTRKEDSAFIKECTERPARFEETIKKVKILNFAADNILKKNKSKPVAKIANIKIYIWKWYVWKVIIFANKKKVLIWILCFNICFC